MSFNITTLKKALADAGYAVSKTEGLLGSDFKHLFAFAHFNFGLSPSQISYGMAYPETITPAFPGHPAAATTATTTTPVATPAPAAAPVAEPTPTPTPAPVASTEPAEPAVTETPTPTPEPVTETAPATSTESSEPVTPAASESAAS